MATLEEDYADWFHQPEYVVHTDSAEYFVETPAGALLFAGRRFRALQPTIQLDPVDTGRSKRFLFVQLQPRKPFGQIFDVLGLPANTLIGALDTAQPPSRGWPMLNAGGDSVAVVETVKHGILALNPEYQIVIGSKTACHLKSSKLFTRMQINFSEGLESDEAPFDKRLAIALAVFLLPAKHNQGAGGGPPG